MGLPGTCQVRLFSPRPTTATVSCSSLPAYVQPTYSPSLTSAVGARRFLVHPKVADPLGIRSGDDVKVEFVDIGETFTLEVGVTARLSSDVLIHDLGSLGIAKNITIDYQVGCTVTLPSGNVLRIPNQEMWAGMKVVELKGSATLHFDGASRNNPVGPTGYGFHIQRDDNEDELVRGYGYAGMHRTSNEMEYMALIEGLRWATRLDLETLNIKGDSELVIRQLKDEYRVQEPRLQALHTEAKSSMNNLELRVVFQHISRKENTVADCLANLGIDSRQNVVAVHWTHVNDLMRQTDDSDEDFY